MKTTNENYKKELEILAEGLKKRNISFKFHKLWDGYQIVAEGWDAICHSGSYGHEEGLLETMGLKDEDNDDDDVIGYLTANEVLELVDKQT